MGEKITDLSQAVFVQSTNEAFKRTNTHTNTHAHTHTDIYTHTHTHTYTRAHGHTDESNRRGCNALHFAWKSGCRLIALDISWRRLVRLDSWHPLTWWRWYRPSAPYPPRSRVACIKARAFTLKMKVKYVDNLDEIWQANVSCQHKCVYSNWRFYVQPLFVLRHRKFRVRWKDARTNAHNFKKSYKSHN